MKEIKGKTILVRVRARFESARVEVTEGTRKVMFIKCRRRYSGSLLMSEKT